MKRAVPIETVRAHVEDQFARAEAAYERAHDLEPDPRNPEWSRVWTRYAWLHWLERKSLRRAERAGVGAVLALDPGEDLLEQLALLGEQLHAQGRIVEPYGTTSVGTVPRDLTQDAVEPYWPAATVLSASARRWHRYSDRETLARRVREKREQERAELNRLAQPGNEAERREVARRRLEGFKGFQWEPGQSVPGRGNESAPSQTEEPAVIDEAIEFELRLRDVIQKLGGFRPLPGLDEVHRQAERAAGHIANWRILQRYAETTERDLRSELEIAREAAHAAVEAARAAQPDTDTTGLEAIARDIDKWIRSRNDHGGAMEKRLLSDKELERRLWEVAKALGGATPIPGYEEAHHQAELTACHFAAYRQLQNWGTAAATAEAAERLEQARAAIDRTLAAYQSSDTPRDRVGQELAELARLLSRTGPA